MIKTQEGDVRVCNRNRNSAVSCTIQFVGEEVEDARERLNMEIEIWVCVHINQGIMVFPLFVLLVFFCSADFVHCVV